MKLFKYGTVLQLRQVDDLAFIWLTPLLGTTKAESVLLHLGLSHLNKAAGVQDKVILDPVPVLYHPKSP